MKMKNKIIIGVVGLVILIQFFGIDKVNPQADDSQDFIIQSNPPTEVANLIKTSCYDCHSNETKYPWYSNVTPVSWWVKHHIDEAREELNFSEWGTYKLKRKDHKLEESIEEIEHGEMPLKSYLWTHGDAKLNDAQKEQVISWMKAQRAQYKMDL